MISRATQASSDQTMQIKIGYGQTDWVAHWGARPTWFAHLGCQNDFSRALGVSEVLEARTGVADWLELRTGDARPTAVAQQGYPDWHF